MTDAELRALNASAHRAFRESAEAVIRDRPSLRCRCETCGELRPLRASNYGLEVDCDCVAVGEDTPTT